uniref:ADAM metallopeptidase domain 19b n=1 Tax=Mastacembelus armatus TaxID=205130 RepID=A0A3Q3LYH2_9TELE
MKYVELLIVADKAEFEKHGSNLDKTKLKLLEAANLVDKYYKALSIRVALIGLEVWTHQDMINVSDNPHSTLAAFLSWRRKQLRAIPNDNAQLITGKSFQGTTIGLAPLKAMCSDYQSGGVNSDHSDPAVGVAATMAHEMGHNFGMSHDSEGCCQARAEDGGCIMAAATGHPFPRVFNGCNQRELKSYLDSGGGKCLFNLPNTSVMFGGQRCGNGYLEDGEECDCGEEEECTSPCCNANNCTLKAGAECAHGVCCDNCKLKTPGVLCRAPSGPCDLPEYCDGKAESCPANFYLLDGTSCAGGQAYCYTGMCLTLEQQCQSLWGRDGRPAPDLCFEKVNEAGDMYGNCGKDLFGKYRSCKNRDAKCGKIQCLTSASKPIENNAVRIETTVSVGSKRIQCMGTHVYKPGQGDEEAQGDTLDPGLVMAGTKCGDDSVRLCNNKHNCHCDSGWAPPWCDQKGSGGSVDSGPQRAQTSQPQIKPVTFPQRQYSPQAYTPPPFKSTQLTEQRRTQAPAPPSGPPPLPSLHTKSHSQPLTVSKPRPDPPNRPPPPCPVNRPSAVISFCKHF